MADKYAKPEKKTGKKAAPAKAAKKATDKKSVKKLPPWLDK